MHDFWNQVILSNPLKKYVIVASTILMVVILRRYLSLLIAGFLFRIVRRVSAGVDKPSFVSLVKGPIQTFLVVFISFTSIEKLHFPEDLNFDIYEVSSKTIIHAIATIIIIIGFIWLLLRMVDFIALILQRKAHASGDIRDNQLVVFFRDFMKIILGVIGFMMILSMAFRWQINSLLGSLGIAGAALALAAKESIENLIASFIIFFDKPFTAGDVLNVNNISGTVERIGLRSTRIRTDQKTYVTVPNKQMVDSIVDNLTLRTQRKAEIRLQLSLSTSSDNLDRFIGATKLILKRDNIQTSSAFLSDITGTSFQVNVDYFTSPVSQDVFNTIKQQVNLEILRLLERLSIEISGASTDIRMSSGNNNPPPAAT